MGLSALSPEVCKQRLRGCGVIFLSFLSWVRDISACLVGRGGKPGGAGSSQSQGGHQC